MFHVFIIYGNIYWFSFPRWHTILWHDVCRALWKTAPRLQDGETQKLWWWGVSSQPFYPVFAVKLFPAALSANVFDLLLDQLWADEAVLEGPALRETSLLPNLCPAQQDAGSQEGNVTLEQ